MKVIPFSVVAMLYFSGISLATAQETAEQDKWRVGAALGSGFLSESVSGMQGDSDTNGFSSKLDMGYDFNQYVGVYGSYDFAQHGGSESDLNLVSMGIKGKEYLTDRLSFFGKVGATYLTNGDNDNGLIGSFGLGLEYQLTNATSMRLGADYYNDLEISPTREGDLIQVYWGMSYRFGQPETPMVLTKTVEIIKEVPVEVIREVEIIKEVNKKVVISSANSEKLFSHNSSLLMSTKSLESPLEMLKKDSKLKIKIVGHTDNTGSEKYNQWMSIRRAESVADYFISNGIASSRITTLGKGEYEPIANNKTELGRARNRRVELMVE